MRRRDLIKVIAGSAVAWPLIARAQQPAMPVVGFLSSRSPGESASVVAAFREGLRETGFIEGQNLGIAFRWAEGRYDRFFRTREFARDTTFRSWGSTICVRSKRGDVYDTDRFFGGLRSSRNWPCAKPKSSRRQHHGHGDIQCKSGRQTPRIDERPDAKGWGDWIFAEPSASEVRA